MNAKPSGAVPHQMASRLGQIIKTEIPIQWGNLNVSKRNTGKTVLSLSENATTHALFERRPAAKAKA